MTALKLASIRADVARETEGEWVSIPEWPGVRLRVRSFNYGPYRTALSQSLRRLSQRFPDGIPTEEDDAETGRLYAAHILMGWDGFDVPYTPEAAAAALSEVGHRDLRRNVGWAASRVAKVEAEYVETASGN